MRPRDLSALEFDRVLARLSDFASSSGGKAACLALKPKDERVEVERELDQVEEVLRLDERAGDMPLGDFPDVRDTLHHASHVGFILDGHALLAVRRVLDAAHFTEAFLDKHARSLPLLVEHIARLDPIPALRAVLARSIDDDGQVTDHASDELAEARQRLRGLRAQLTRRLEELIHRPNVEDLLSDRYITLRNNRFVVPVKTTNLAQFNGVVQDRSVSGETTFVEPPFAVELNNRLLIAAKDEEAIVRRILADLTVEVADHAETIGATYAELVCLDALRARARFARKFHCIRPMLDDSQILLRQARHPVLLFGERPVIAVDILMPPSKRALVITGPNTGGKSVGLKTLGLLALMTQSGIPIPAADGSCLPCFRAVYADIGDQQSIERNLSTFSSHLANIAGISTQGVGDSLVLLDEPGVGTEPEEGAALGIGVIRYLVRAGAWVAVTTHYTPIKVFALSHETAICAAVDFDPEAMEAKYRLVYHTAGESLALPVARRMGLPMAMLAEAESARSEQAKRFATAMTELEQARRQYEERVGEAQEQLQAAKADRREAERLLAELRERKRQKWSDELDRARGFVRQLREQGRELLSAIERGEADRRAFTKVVREQEAAVAAKIDEVEERPELPPQAPPRIGDEVEVAGSEIRGQLVSIQGERAWIQRGSMRFEVPLAPLRRMSGGKGAADRKVDVRLAPKSEETAAQREIHLIGLRAREALEKLEPFLDQAVQASLQTVRIVHGMGSGALRRAVAEYLDTCPYCASYRLGEPNEGGSGATIVTLAT